MKLPVPLECLCAACDGPAGNGLGRREFLKWLGVGAAAFASQSWHAMAGPFTREDFDRLVPADKRLRPEWVASLTDRGRREVYRGSDLEQIGMPIGGLCAGQLYLGGDGRLWHWDIFNQPLRTGADHYAKPMSPASPLTQGFAVRVKSRGRTQERLLGSPHWRDISFTGEYPIGYVDYQDPDCPVDVSLEAFSPFIPLNTNDSSLPATVMLFTVRNTGADIVEAELAGWLENAVCLYSAKIRAGTRHNRIVRGRGTLLLECSAQDDIAAHGQSSQSSGPLATAADFGTLALALLDTRAGDFGLTTLPDEPSPSAALWNARGAARAAQKPFTQKLVGGLGRRLKLAPGASAEVVFVLSWHMPNLALKQLPTGRFYATRFPSALEVAAYVAGEFPRLRRQTRLWHDTWYDSTLPWWFLSRTFANTSILASSTCHRFGNGRFYGWEGVGCCEGTCGHVWHYAHAVARLFPDLERNTREQVDFGLALQTDGAIYFRGELNRIPAVDAQAGTVLRAFREHQMSADGVFLKRNWPAIRKATEWLIRKDTRRNGLIEGNQHNTLDTDWHGPVAWLSGLYLAALLAAEAMAVEVGDSDFSAECRRLFTTGTTNLVAELFDKDYFINRPDPAHLDAINSGTGCHIDQVMGQSWAFQVGLPRVLPQKETVTALNSLWRYNFTPDVGPYRQVYKPGRWYAMPGEAGLLMCSFPRSDWDYTQAKGKGPEWAAGYFNECMNGFEYQVAGHMLWEGLLTEGLAITRAVHDRYHPSRRNPWNEVECGDHYARSMASYGVYLAACGYGYHGPKASLAFAPRLSPHNFRAAFTAAGAWGVFSQAARGRSQKAEIQVNYGVLQLRELTLGLLAKASPAAVEVRKAGKSVPARLALEDGKARITLGRPALLIKEGEKLEIDLR